MAGCRYQKTNNFYFFVFIALIAFKCLLILIFYIVFKMFSAYLCGFFFSVAFNFNFLYSFHNVFCLFVWFLFSVAFNFNFLYSFQNVFHLFAWFLFFNPCNAFISCKPNEFCFYKNTFKKTSLKFAGKLRTN